jgi:hypothetical protein
MDFLSLASALLQQPTPELLWGLRADILASRGSSEDKQSAALEVLTGEFYTYLHELRSKTSARGFNRLASLLDLTSVGILALEDIITLREKVVEKLLLGGLAESLMLIGSFQYVKAWDRETDLIHLRAAWFLYGELWRFSVSAQPVLPAVKRQELLNSLLAPLHHEKVPTPIKVALAGRIFQVLILTYLVGLLPTTEPGTTIP